MTDYDKLYIGGAWVAPATDQVLEVFSPATEERVGSCPIAAPADIDAAVSAARAAFEGPWSRTTPAERGAILAKAAKLIEERSAEINQLISNEMGQPPAMVGMMQQTPSMATLGYYAELADKFAWEEKRTGAFGQTKVTREPVGVVAAVLAWNVPLFLAINKLAPALLAGCTVLLKPAPESPLSVHVIAEIFTEAGVPEGVISVLPGGAETGEYLVSHAGIDKITFTGSSAVGRKIGAIAAQNLKRCSLELGGKSAAIILEDADIAAGMPMLVMSGLMNTGQACVAQTRILAPRSRYDEVIEGMKTAAGFMTVGDPSDPAAQLGPLISEKQRERVEGYIAKGKEEGARVVLGGGRPAGPGQGLVCRADDLRRRGQLDDHRTRGDLRTRSLGDPVRLRGRGHQDRQRFGLRPRRIGVDHRHRSRTRSCRADPHGYLRDQLVRLRSRITVRWLQELRYRSRERT